MARGGKRQNAGRKVGSTTRIKVLDYFTKKELKKFWDDLKIRAKTDSKVALYFAEQMTGKAPQPITGEEGNPISIQFSNLFNAPTTSKTSEGNK